MSDAETKTAQLVVRMPAEMHAAIAERAKAEDRSMAQVVRRALRLYLAGHRGAEG